MMGKVFCGKEIKTYKENVQLVYRFLLIKCHNDTLAEDLIQETFYEHINHWNDTTGLARFCMAEEDGDEIVWD